MRHFTRTLTLIDVLMWASGVAFCCLLVFVIFSGCDAVFAEETYLGVGTVIDTSYVAARTEHGFDHVNKIPTARHYPAEYHVIVNIKDRRLIVTTTKDIWSYLHEDVEVKVYERKGVVYHDYRLGLL